MEEKNALIRELVEKDEKERLALNVLRALPDWFGIEESLVSYARDSRDQIVLEVMSGGQAAGFLALKEHFSQTWEIAVLGLYPQYHLKGLGRRLVDSACRLALEKGVTYLTVKTVRQPEGGPAYLKTLAFYQAMGFVPLEVFPTLWDERNPCLMLVLGLKDWAKRRAYSGSSPCL